MLRAGHAIGRMIAAARLAALIHAIAVLPSVSALADKPSQRSRHAWSRALWRTCAAEGFRSFSLRLSPRAKRRRAAARPARRICKSQSVQRQIRGRAAAHHRQCAAKPDDAVAGRALFALSADRPVRRYRRRARDIVTFHIDPRARFSDNTPILASDVLFSFELLKSKGRPSVSRGFRLGQVRRCARRSHGALRPHGRDGSRSAARSRRHAGSVEEGDQCGALRRCRYDDPARLWPLS